MILDAHNEFSDGQAVTVNAVSDKVVDTGTPQQIKKDLGGPEPIYLCIQVGAAFASAGGATLMAELVTADDADLAQNAAVLFSTPAVPAASLTQGALMAVVSLPAGEYRRYLGMRYTVGNGPMTGGGVNAFLTRDPQLWRAYRAEVGR